MIYRIAIPHPHQLPSAIRPQPQHTHPSPPTHQPQQPTSRSTHQWGNQQLTGKPIRILFKTGRDIFSNYYQTKVYIFDPDFPDNEHAIQHRKAVVTGWTDLIKEILEAPNTERDKEIGETVLLQIKDGMTWNKV